MIAPVNLTTANFWPIRRQYPFLSLPETWDTLQNFVTWYLKNGKPILIPYDACTFRTDDATAITLFRHSQYQVEMYIIHPGYTIPKHSHPGLEVITMYLGGGGLEDVNPRWNTSVAAGATDRTLEGEYHGGDPTSEGRGFALLSFEKWLNGMPTSDMASAALQWKGPTAGPIHDALVSTKFGVPVNPGEFDITTVPQE